MTEPSAADWEAIDQAIYADRTVEAVRLYRLATGVGIAPGIAAIETRRAALPQVPAAVSAFQASGFAPRGELWAFWRNRDGDWCVLTRLAATPDSLSLDVFPPRVGNWGQQLNGMTINLRELDQALTDATGPPGADWSGDQGVRQRLRVRLAGAAPPAAAAPPPGRMPDACANGSCVFLLDGAIWERDWGALHEVLPRTAWDACWQSFLSAGNLDPPAAEPVEAMDGDRVRCTAASGQVLWERCHAACARAGLACSASDTWWSDLEAQPPPWEDELGAEARSAWSLLLALGDAGGRRRELLPWWLAAAGKSDGARIGLLSPLESRRLHAQAGALRQLFRRHALAADLDGILRLAETASAQGGWLVGRESGS